MFPRILALIALCSLPCWQSPTARAGDEQTDIVSAQDVRIGSKGSSRFQAIEIPADAIGVGITITGPTDALYYIDYLESPTFERVVEPSPWRLYQVKPRVLDELAREWAPAPAFFSPNRSSPQLPGVGFFSVPNSPAVALKPGRWHFRIGAIRNTEDGSVVPYTDGISVSYRAFIKRYPEEPKRTKLNVRIYVLTDSLFRASQLENNPEFTEALAAPFRRVGIELNIEKIEELARGTPEGGHPEFLTLANAVESFRGVPVFFHDGGKARLGSRAFALGSSNSLDPVQRGGVFIGGADLTMYPSMAAHLGRTAAHEIGHVLGLFHVTQYAYPAPIEDAEWKSWENVMSPYIEKEHDRFSEGQAWVMKRHVCMELLLGKTE